MRWDEMRSDEMNEEAVLVRGIPSQLTGLGQLLGAVQLGGGEVAPHAEGLDGERCEEEGEEERHPRLWEHGVNRRCE
jgi:hypothetical protein